MLPGARRPQYRTRWQISLPPAPLSRAIVRGRSSKAESLVISASSVALGYAPIYVAQELGYFKQMNIEAEILPSSSGPASIAAVMRQIGRAHV